jgi:monoamine oxidase
MKHALLAVLALAFAVPQAAPDEFVTRLPDQEVRVTVMGFASARFEAPAGDPEVLPETYDAIIAGGGLSGLTACFYLKDKKVVVLERAERPGGLAARGVTTEGVAYARGSAYYAEPPETVMPLYEEMGLTPLKETLIPSPIDAYFRKGELIVDMWEEAAFKKLPRPFRDFHRKLLKDDEKGKIAIQPLDKAEDLSLDRMSAAEYIRDFGPEVKAYLDSYCQSALGCLTDDVSALAFTNFYSSEIVERYAWPGGTGGASVVLGERLRDFVRTGCTVTRVEQDAEGVTVDFISGGRLRRARGRYAILAVPLRVVDYIFPGLPEDRRKLIREIKYADYVVHQVFTPGLHVTKAYDTWFVDRSFTDVIAARWMETKGYREPAREGPGILSIYQPLEPRRGIKALDPETVNGLAVKAVQELYDFVPALKGEKVLRVESYRWPSSIHIVPPGYFTNVAPKLIGPVGRVHFAGNNLGTPSFEESIYRGHQAAQAVRGALK